MKLVTTAKFLMFGLVFLLLVVEVAANDPIFVKWLVVDDPGDETIRHYWQRAEAGELGPNELVDLGTMLFYRGYPNDAITYFREALKLEPEASEPWFRIGLVEHREGDLSGARSAYKKCLKRQSGHGWANFYLGLLEEQTGDAKSAMEHFQQAFKYAPELADPKVNPEILSSRLQLGAQVRHFDGERFEKSLPMRYMEPAEVRKVRKQFTEPSMPMPTPTTAPEAGVRVQPTPAPKATAEAGSEAAATGRRQPSGTAGAAAAGGSAARGGSRSGSGSTSEAPATGASPYGFPTPVNREGGGTGGGSPQIGNTSPDASLRPLWPGLHDVITAIV
jgi:hypothetical protein